MSGFESAAPLDPPTQTPFGGPGGGALSSGLACMHYARHAIPQDLPCPTQHVAWLC